MASSSNVFKYPPRLYAEGKSPLQHRSMNHNCYLSKIGQIREGLGIDVWDGLEKSSLGVFIKLAELEYTWAAKKVHLFLTNQLKVDNFHEIWSMIDGRPVRFSLNEFAAITGLNCDPFDPSEKFEADHRELWEAMKVPISEGPKFNELRTVMDLSKAWDLKERMMVGRLCLLSVAIHGVHHGSRFPLSSAIRVLDPVSFEKYPWGRVAFECLLKSVKTVDFNKDGYVIKGCVHALLMWVRVRHMIPVTEENMYPQWSNAEEDKDPALDNLIKDIIHNRLALDAWKGVPAFGVSKKKRKVKATVDEGSSTQKGKKIKKAEFSGEERVKIQKEDEKIVSEDIQVDKDDKKGFSDILLMMEKMNGSIVDMGKNLSSRIDDLENTFDSQIVAVETDLKELKQAKPASIPTAQVANSINNEDEGASSKSPASYSLSWKVEEKPSSVDGLPVQRVVKKTYTVQKKVKKEGETSGDLLLIEKKDGSKAERKKSEKAPLKEEATKAAKRGVAKPPVKAAVKEKAAKNQCLKAVVKKEAVKKDGSKAGNKMKKKSTTQEDDVVDITDKVEEEALKMVSSSEDTYSDPGLQKANKELDATLTVMVEKLKDLDEGVTVGKRVPQLAGSQKYPFLGNSTVKRIITDGEPSSSIPNHMMHVSDEKIHQLFDFLETDDE
ncbi:unnamed protein product [Arabidopsis lyrata]|nr:unnamed protein product [Arabidopsis lyrata]